MLSGDFRQTLPLMPRSTYTDEINACLKYSILWRNVHTLEFTTNMRVTLLNDFLADSSKQLLDIGNGTVVMDQSTRTIDLPNGFWDIMNTKELLINNVFPNVSENING